MTEVSIKLQPKQIELYKLITNSPYSWIGYGGSAGGAKSHAIRDVALIIGSEVPKVKSLIMRRISKELLDNHINPFFAKYPELRQYFNKTERIIYLPNGSLIRFGSADEEQEIYSYQGSEYDLIFVDEATHFTQTMLEFLKTRNRTTLSGFSAKMILTMNPGNIGHAFIKRIFIDKSYRENEVPSDYYFLIAKIYDNAIWSLPALSAQGLTAKDYYSWDDVKKKEFCYQYSDYANTLRKLPKQLADAYLEGDWETFAGMFFKQFDKQKQVIEPFQIPEQWEMVMSVDPGYSSPCSVGITARDLNGHYYRVATYYESGKSPQSHAQDVNVWIKTLIDNKIIPYAPKANVAGRDAWAKKDRYSIIANELTFADVWQSEGIFLMPAVTDRVMGWWTWKALMPDKYFVFKGYNQPLLDEIDPVLGDDKKPEDIQGRGNDPAVLDHALDEQRYGIMRLFKPIDEQPTPPKPTGRQEAVMNTGEINYANY